MPSAELLDAFHVAGALVPQPGQVVTLLVRGSPCGPVELVPMRPPAMAVAVLLFVTPEDARRLGACDLPAEPAPTR